MANRLPKKTPNALKPRVISTSLKVRIKFNDNIRGRNGHAAWFRFLVKKKKDFYKRINSDINNSQNTNFIKFGIARIIRDKIYNAYPDPGTRTYKIQNSPRLKKIESSGNDVGGLVFYMNNSTAPAKTGQQQGKNYAIFFLYPEELHTFIKPRGVRSPPVNYRDFFGIESDEGTIKEFMSRYAPGYVAQSIENVLNKTKPTKMA